MIVTRERTSSDEDPPRPKPEEDMEIMLKRGKAAAATLASIVLALQGVHVCAAPAAAPYIPPPVSVTISPQTQGGNVSVAVEVLLPDTLHYVGGWGQPMLVGNTAYADTQFWVITNMVGFPVIIPVSTNYSLGMLPPGNYSFCFRAWGVTVKTEGFSVAGPSPPRLRILRLSSSQARLSWPTNATDYALHCALALPTPEWVAVTNLSSVVGDEFALTIDLTGGQKLYALRRR